MSDYTIIDCEQRSTEWIAARIGRLTGSVAHEAFAKTKTGWSTSRRNLLLRIVLERVTGKPQGSDFVSPAMQDGIDREPAAIAAYEAMTGEMVRRCGFVQHDTLLAGCSPDGYVGDFETMLSIKCRQPAAHYEFLRRGTIPADALTQLRHECWITGARQAVYCGYSPDFPEPLQLRFATLSASDLDIWAYETDVRVFLAECEAEYNAMMTLCDPDGRLADAVVR